MPSPTALAKMIPLPTQEVFESIFFCSLKQPVLIAFSASWCGPCQKINWDFIIEEFPSLPIYYCDVDVNKYTAGYCGVKSIPTVLMLLPGDKKSTLVSPLQSSNTAQICTYIQSNTKLIKHSS